MFISMHTGCIAFLAAYENCLLLLIHRSLTCLAQQTGPARPADAVHRFLAVSVATTAQNLTFGAIGTCPTKAAPGKKTNVS